MNPGILVLLLMMATLMAGAVITYERLLARTRAERDEAIADCDLFSELLLEDAARKRHPSAQQFGGGNLRVVR